MKRMVGALLMAVGAFCAFQFAGHATLRAGVPHGTEFDFTLPFRSLGSDYPADVLWLLGAVWALGIGLGWIVLGDGGGRSGGMIGRITLLNALLLISTLFAACVGANAGQDPAAVAVFALVALLQIAGGILLLVLALFEHPKGIVSLTLGTLVYLFGVGVGVMAFLWGGA